MIACAACGTPAAEGTPTCMRCGRSLPVGGCPRCAAPLFAGQPACANCGLPVAPPVAAPSAYPQQAPPPRPFLQAIATDNTGILPLVAVALVCGIVSLIGWLPLSLPSRIIHDIVDVGNCTSKQPGTRDMYLCSARVGAMTMAGPITTLVVLFLLRTPIMRGTKRLAERTPEHARFLIGPVLGTVMFTIPWAGAHYKTSGLNGFLPQTVFPAIVGLFTFTVTRWGPAIQRRLGRFFDARDRVPAALRLVVATLTPALLAWLITRQDRVSDTALKEQIIVLVALMTGYLALTPRSGSLAAGARAMFGQRRPPAYQQERRP